MTLNNWKWFEKWFYLTNCKRVNLIMVSKQFSFPAVNISIYALDFTGDCIVTCYEHGETLHESIVYIADIEQ